MSAGMFFRASVRRAAVLPPLWLGRRPARPCMIGGPIGGGMAHGAITFPDFELPVVECDRADARSGPNGSAAAVSSGATTGPLGESAPANVDQSWTELPSPAEPDPGAAGEPGPAAHPHPSTVRPARAPKPDWGRVAMAARARPIGPAPKRAPTRHAMERGPCPRCGIPGTRGCDHQLPYDEAAL